MTFCFPLKGHTAHSPVKLNFAQGIEFEKDVSISCTEKDVLMYVFRVVVHSRETDIIQIWLWNYSIFFFCKYRRSERQSFKCLHVRQGTSKRKLVEYGEKDR